MRKILEDFYYGNITPCDQQMAPDSEMKRAVDRIFNCGEQNAYFIIKPHA